MDPGYVLQLSFIEKSTNNSATTEAIDKIKQIFLILIIFEIFWYTFDKVRNLSNFT